MISRSRHYSGALCSWRTCKSYLQRLKTGKYRSLVLVVIVFSAWLSLHFVRATAEYHMPRDKDQIIINLQGDVLKLSKDDDFGSTTKSGVEISTAEFTTKPSTDGVQQLDVGLQANPLNTADHNHGFQNVANTVASSSSPSSTGRSTTGSNSKPGEITEPDTKTDSTTSNLLATAKLQNTYNNGRLTGAIGPIYDKVKEKLFNDAEDRSSSSTTETLVTKPYDFIQNIGRYDNGLEQQRIPDSEPVGNQPINNVINTERSSSTTQRVITKSLVSFGDNNANQANKVFEQIHNKLVGRSTESSTSMAPSGTSTASLDHKDDKLLPAVNNNIFIDNLGNNDNKIIYNSDNNVQTYDYQRSNDMNDNIYIDNNRVPSSNGDTNSNNIAYTSGNSNLDTLNGNGIISSHTNSNVNYFNSNTDLDSGTRETTSPSPRTSTSELSATTHLIGNTAANINKNDKIMKIENEQQYIVEQTAVVKSALNVKNPLKMMVMEQTKFDQSINHPNTQVQNGQEDIFGPQNVIKQPYNQVLNQPQIGLYGTQQILPSGKSDQLSAQQPGAIISTSTAHAPILPMKNIFNVQPYIENTDNSIVKN